MKDLYCIKSILFNKNIKKLNKMNSFVLSDYNLPKLKKPI